MSDDQSRLPWARESWDLINAAVEAECRRTKVAAKFLPPMNNRALSGSRTTVPADNISEDSSRLIVDEGETLPLVETWVEFMLTQQQVASEEELRIANTLAVRAANLLARAQDVLLFQGYKDSPSNLPSGVQIRQPPKIWLLSPDLPAGQIISVGQQQQQQPPPPASDPPKWGENTFKAVAQGYAKLQNEGHYGPYALVLWTDCYADTYAPVKPTSLTMPADRIMPLVTAGFHGSGALPEYTGLLVSVGGNSMDLVVGREPETSFVREEPDGRYTFRVSERFVLRLKNSAAVIKLEFDH